jgi:hypothetical protein
MRSAIESFIASASITPPSAVSDEDRSGSRRSDTSAVATPIRCRSPRSSSRSEGQGPRAREVPPRGGPRRRVEVRGSNVLYRELLAEDPEMSDVWLQLAQVGPSGDPRMRYRLIKRSSSAIQGRGQPDRWRPDSCAWADRRGAEARRARLGVTTRAAHELLAKWRSRARSRHGTGEAKLAQEAIRPCRCRSTWRVSSLTTKALRRGAGPADARPPELQGRTLQMNDLNYYIAIRSPGSSATVKRNPTCWRKSRYSRTTRGPRGPRHAVSRDGPGRDSERAIAELLRVSPTSEGRTSPCSSGPCSRAGEGGCDSTRLGVIINSLVRRSRKAAKAEGPSPGYRACRHLFRGAGGSWAPL